MARTIDIANIANSITISDGDGVLREDRSAELQRLYHCYHWVFTLGAQ